MAAPVPTCNNKPKRKRARTSSVWEHYEVDEATLERQCRYCEQKFKHSTSTGTLKAHYNKEHLPTRLREIEHFTSLEMNEHRRTALILFISGNRLPFRLVETPNFQRLLHSFDPHFVIPTRVQLSRLHLPITRTMLIGAMRCKLALINAVALTFDGWTSDNRDGFLGLTAHGIDAAFKRNNFLLDLVPVQSEKADNLVVIIKGVLDEWQLTDKVVMCMTDGGANMQAAADRLKIPRIYCLAHVLNRALHKAFEASNISTLIDHAKAISHLFRISTLAKHTLAAIQPTLNEPIIKVKAYNQTRWNSVYLMLESILRCERSISAAISALALQRDKVHATIPAAPKSEDWLALHDIKNVLQPLYEVTQLLQSENATLGVSHLLLHRLYTVQLQPVTADSTLVKDLKRVVSQHLKKRWDIYNPQQSVLEMASVFLDPRSKTLEAIPTESSQRFLLFSRIRDQLEQLQPPQPLEEEELGGGNALLSRLFGDAARIPGARGFQGDFQEYYRLPAAPLTVQKQDGTVQLLDPLEWWQTAGSAFPTLVPLACQLLAISPTSGASERVFSNAGLVVSDRRHNLSPQTVSAQTFIAVNQHHTF